MEESESGELRPPSKWQRNESEVLSKMKTMRDDPNSRPFSFSHGYVLFRSKPLTVIVQGFLAALGVSIVLGVSDSLTGFKHATWIHILHFRISLTNLWLIIMIAALLAAETTFLFNGARYRVRRVAFSIVFILVLVAPNSLFHWDR